MPVIVDSSQTYSEWNYEGCPLYQIPGRDMNSDSAKYEAEAADNSAWVLDTYKYHVVNDLKRRKEWTD